MKKKKYKAPEPLYTPPSVKFKLTNGKKTEYIIWPLGFKSIFDVFDFKPGTKVELVEENNVQ